MDSRERRDSAKLPCEEPSALDAHARFRGGRGAVMPSPTRPVESSPPQSVRIPAGDSTVSLMLWMRRNRTIRHASSVLMG